MTAYVINGLFEARSLGVSVRGDVLERGSAWLKARVSARSEDPADVRAYIAYSLAVAKQIDQRSLDALFGARAQLSPYGIALLGIALEQNKDTRAGTLGSQNRAHGTTK
jgi:hypothetical protein